MSFYCLIKISSFSLIYKYLHPEKNLEIFYSCEFMFFTFLFFRALHFHAGTKAKKRNGTKCIRHSFSRRV